MSKASPDAAQRARGAVLNPKSGVRTLAEGNIPPPAPPRQAYPGAAGLAANLQRDSAASPLLRCASWLLLVGAELRVARNQPDPDGLLTTLAGGITDFMTCAMESGFPERKAKIARYVLCTYLDEAAMSKPWGVANDWASHGLLLRFYEEAYGGERFFEILKRVREHLTGDDDDLRLLELMYYCLAFGFEGRYGGVPGGADQLKQHQEEIFQLIRRFRPHPGSALSPHWRGLESDGDQLVHYFPLWAVGLILILLFSVLYGLFKAGLAVSSEEPFKALAAINGPKPSLSVEIREPPIPPVPAESLCIILADIRRERVLELDCAEPRRQVVVLTGEHLFGNQKWTVGDKSLYHPIIDRIDQALRQLSGGRKGGTIEVVGHADSNPSTNPDNYTLSLRRAESIREMLSLSQEQPERFKPARGASDSDPRYPSDSELDALNRRVEILLQH